MKKKLLIVALVAGLLPTLFSCKGSIKIEQDTDGLIPPAIPTISGYKQRIIDIPSGTLYEIITPKDTFLVFSKSQTGMALLKQSPVK